MSKIISPEGDDLFECLSYMYTVSLELMQVIHNACLYKPIKGITKKNNSLFNYIPTIEITFVSIFKFMA